MAQFLYTAIDYPVDLAIFRVIINMITLPHIEIDNSWILDFFFSLKIVKIRENLNMWILPDLQYWNLKEINIDPRNRMTS